MSRAEDRAALFFWGNDPLLASIMEADPASGLFREALDVLSRVRVPMLSERLRAADMRDVLTELHLPHSTLASLLEIAAPLAYAIGAGWHRPPALGLFQIARELGVSVGTFFHDVEFETRPRVRLYREWQEIDDFEA